MGIKHFWTGWFKKRFAKHILQVKADNLELKTGIDTLMIDMNGIFHNSAQKIFQYGNHKPRERLLNKKVFPQKTAGKPLKVFQDVCETVNKVVNMIKPNKRLIMCVDGPAPRGKQAQQRARRFMSAMDSQTENRTFDSNCITPGTKFMDHLTKYIDWYIRKRMSEEKGIWTNLEIVFSTEKSEGEGEHKLINYIRKYGNPSETFCIHGMDADLVMLALGTQLPNFYILREDLMETNFDYYLIDIGNVRKDLEEIMRWENKTNPFSPFCAVNDFIFMCFAVGNDFLPHIPAIEIIQGGIDFMIDTYKKVGVSYGHITGRTVKFRPKALAVFLGTISQYEKGILEDKLEKRDKYFPDTILDANSKLVDKKYQVDIEKYREEYYKKKLNIQDEKQLETISHAYLEGMQWVLTYYTQGVPNWDWQYMYHYAPFAYTLAKYTENFDFPEYSETHPTVPFVQLLCVLPPKSADLLPAPLDNVLSTHLKKYCPENFEVDLSGKRQNWEGTVILPIIEYKEVEKIYFKNILKVDDTELRRNILQKSIIYTREMRSFFFKSYYGDFVCKVTTKSIDL